MSDFDKNLCISLRANLNKEDGETQTYGCRHSNPGICGYSYLEGVCAFVDEDKICRHPTSSWKKIYNELKEKN